VTRTKQPFIQAILRLNRYLSRYELILLLLCLTVFLRLPSLFEPAWYGDENIYLSIGQSVASGARLYQDITDYPNKPPMIYLLAAVTGSVPAFRFILLVWQIFGTLAFFLLISRLIESKTARVLATLAYIFLTSTPVLEGNVANAEIFFIVPVMFAAWLIFTHATRPRTRKTLLLVTGLAMGFAFLFKIHVLLDIFAFSLYLVFDRFIFHRRILKLLKRNFHLLLYLAGLAAVKTRRGLTPLLINHSLRQRQIYLQLGDPGYFVANYRHGQFGFPGSPLCRNCNASDHFPPPINPAGLLCFTLVYIRFICRPPLRPSLSPLFNSTDTFILTFV
jgi:hypothetical protein